jgi:hypothetical protein
MVVTVTQQWYLGSDKRKNKLLGDILAEHWFGISATTAKTMMTMNWDIITARLAKEENNGSR